MAPGVYKTFRKEIIEGLSDYLDYAGESSDNTFIQDGIKQVISVSDEELDKYLCFHNPYVRYTESETINDKITKIIKKAVKKTEKATYQAMEGIVHNLNTLHSRAGAQVECCLV